MTALQEQLSQRTATADGLSEQLDAAKSRLQDLESQLEEKTATASSFREEVERLKLRLKVWLQSQVTADGGLFPADDWLFQEEEGRSNSVFHATIEQLTKESQAALQRSAEKSQRIEELQEEKIRLEDQLKQRSGSRGVLRRLQTS